MSIVIKKETAIKIFTLSIFQLILVIRCFAGDCNTQSFQNARDIAIGGGIVDNVNVADFNKDQKLDLAVVVESSKTIHVMFGDGTGNFPTSTQLSVGQWTFAAVVNDFNGDGNPDIAATSFGEGVVYVYLGNGAGGFSGPYVSAAGQEPLNFIAADINGDGKADLAVIGQAQNVSILSGDGTGNFTLLNQFTGGGNVYGIASADLDEDGAIDLVLSNNATHGIAVFYGLGNGGFTQGPSILLGGGEPSWPTIADFNGDGNLDIVATDDNRQFGVFGSQVIVMLATGSRQFSKVTSSPGWSSNDILRVADLNGDQKLDIVTGSGLGTQDQGFLDVRLGNGDGTFGQELSFSSRPNPIDQAVGDFDGDGRPDLISGNYFDSSVSIFVNDGIGDRIPPLLVAPDVTVAADGPAGTAVTFPIFYSDVSQATVTCSIPSGSTFPIGSTPVTCVATDSCGNSSNASFAVNVIDTPPNFSLPPYITTDATSSSGAQVTYFASADDAVSGPLPVQCTPTSGSTFPIGTTTVTCSATDGANNTGTATFNVFVVNADHLFTPPDESYVTIQPANGPTITFVYVEGAGVTTVTPIDAATIGTTPAGFALSSGIAYQISTTATFHDDVQLDFTVPGPIAEADFNNLSILHNHNGTLEDVTVARSYDVQTQSGVISAITNSFSPFYLVKRVGLRPAALFDQTKANKVGSTIPIKLQMVNDAGTNVSASALPLKARNLVWLGSNTTSTVIDAGNANPDLNFRYDSGLRGYIFNLKTTGLKAGSYALSFYVGTERSFFYTVKFEVK